MLTKSRILLLDDDELIISMLARALRKEGYETYLLHSSIDAIDKIKDWQPDLMLLDIDLGEESNGLDLLQTLQTEQIDFPVVMLTGDDSSSSAIRALRYGASDYLHKPFNVEEVKIVIERLLQTARLRDEIAYLKRSNIIVPEEQFIGTSPIIDKVLADTRKIAEAGVPSILITGNQAQERKSWHATSISGDLRSTVTSTLSLTSPSTARPYLKI